MRDRTRRRNKGRSRSLWTKRTTATYKGGEGEWRRAAKVRRTWGEGVEGGGKKRGKGTGGRKRAGGGGRRKRRDKVPVQGLGRAKLQTRWLHQFSLSTTVLPSRFNTLSFDTQGELRY